MKTRHLLGSGLILTLAVFAWGCTKPALYGTLQESEATTKYYQVPPAEAFRAAKEALVYLGYSIKQEDEKNYTLETYWQPTTADSHYVEVFRRKDYGTVGAYYRLHVKVSPRNHGSKVSVVNAAKSYISNLKSSQAEETRLFTKIDDFTRRRDVQVTNVGLQ
jgi:hypothetical protein